MAEKKVTKMEQVDNRPRITLEDAAQRIRKSVSRLEMLMEIGFSDNAQPDGKELINYERRFVSEGLRAAAEAHDGYLGLAEHVLMEVGHEVSQVYKHLTPGGDDTHILALPAFDLSDTRPEVETTLINPMNILSALENMCTRADSVLATLSDRAFDGFIALIADVHTYLWMFIDDIDEYLQKQAA